MGDAILAGFSRRGLFAFVLVACSCAQGMGARALPPLSPEVIVDVVEENYDVRGRTVQEIRLSLALSASSELGLGIRGLHRWDIRWGYQYQQGIESCDVVSVPIEITSRIVSPRWTERDGADRELIEMWEEYITALRAHELTHRELSYLAARDFASELGRLTTPSCETIEALVRATGQQILERYEERNREFDEESQGTINWPPGPSG